MPIIFKPYPEMSERDVQRFWEKVKFNLNPETCWEWVGGKLGDYARFDWSRTRAEKRSLLAHRVAYIMHHKTEPEKIIVQTCGNKMCVNPAHLEARDEQRNKTAYQKGDKVGAFTFLERMPADPQRPTAKFLCDCGKEFTSRIDAVKSGKTKSCGCKTKQFLSEASKIHADAEYTESGVRKMPFFRPEDIQRFWEKVKCDSNAHHCWDWEGGNNGRYGYFNMGASGNLKANRVAYFLHYDEDPEDLKILHTCDRPVCCNPFHLEIGTQQDNMVDMVKKGRHNNQYTKNLFYRK